MRARLVLRLCARSCSQHFFRLPDPATLKTHMWWNAWVCKLEIDHQVYAFIFWPPKWRPILRVNDWTLLTWTFHLFRIQCQSRVAMSFLRCWTRHSYVESSWRCWTAASNMPSIDTQTLEVTDTARPFHKHCLLHFDEYCPLRGFTVSSTVSEKVPHPISTSYHRVS